MQTMFLLSFFFADHSYFLPLEEAAEKLKRCESRLQLVARKNTALVNRNRRLKKKVKSLEEALGEVKDQLGTVNYTYLSDKAADIPKHLILDLNKKLMAVFVNTTPLCGLSL